MIIVIYIRINTIGGNLKGIFKTWVANISVDAKHAPKALTEVKAEFPQMIKRFSKRFIDIYNQALTAEENKLSEIYRLGYSSIITRLV